MDGPVSSPPERRPGEPPGQPLQPSPASRSPGADVDGRLAALEASMADLSRRLERVGDSVEESVRTAVSGELRAATADLRHTVSELGRLLVRDLGKLAQLLAEHRDTIVAELRLPPTGGTPGGGTPPGGTAAGETTAGETVAHDPGGDAVGDPGDSAGEHRRGRLRRRNG